jgi:hypothetical protein
MEAWLLLFRDGRRDGSEFNEGAEEYVLAALDADLFNLLYPTTELTALPVVGDGN